MNGPRLRLFAVVCLTAATCFGCAADKQSAPESTSAAEAKPTAGSTGEPTSTDGLFSAMTGDRITAQGFFVWDLNKAYPDNLRGDQCTSADAAGFPVAALTPTADEVASGAVNHALRFILPNDRMKADVYVPPRLTRVAPRAPKPTPRPTASASG